MIGSGLHLTDFFSRGFRLVNEMNKTQFGNGNGGKITTWMIKYPRIKKNAHTT